MALTEVAICNMALANVGINVTIADVDGTLANSTDTTIEKRTCALWYGTRRDQLLENLPWTFARKYVALVLNDSGDGEVWENEWDYAYTYPADCLKVRRFVNNIGPNFYAYGDQGTNNYDPWRSVSDAGYGYAFVIRNHGDARVILSNLPLADAKIEYTAQVTDVALFTPEFSEALAWTLSESIAMPLTGRSEVYFAARQNAERAIKRGAASIFNEQEPYPTGDGDFIRSRGG